MTILLLRRKLRYSFYRTRLVRLVVSSSLKNLLLKARSLPHCLAASAFAFHALAEQPHASGSMALPGSIPFPTPGSDCPALHLAAPALPVPASADAPRLRSPRRLPWDALVAIP